MCFGARKTNDIIPPASFFPRWAILVVYICYQLMSAYVPRREVNAWYLALIGWVGTLL